jgi:hypothetical protein
MDFRPVARLKAARSAPPIPSDTKWPTFIFAQHLISEKEKNPTAEASDYFPGPQTKLKSSTEKSVWLSSDRFRALGNRK